MMLKELANINQVLIDKKKKRGEKPVNRKPARQEQVKSETKDEYYYSSYGQQRYGVKDKDEK